MKPMFNSSRVQACSRAGLTHVERHSFRIPLRIWATSRGRCPRARVNPRCYTKQVIRTTPEQSVGGLFPISRLSLSRVTSENRVRRLAGEGMASGVGTDRPGLISRCNGSFCYAAGCNCSPREKASVGWATIARDSSKCETTDRRDKCRQRKSPSRLPLGVVCAHSLSRG